ncbi:hypothetical protein VNI00_008705 [Paramarasmius palmivorus]|uniref:Uncharacterized protein n=1 Tax=Paramarasmius palmivorus TaxID=297713 RepID=A0AAW0CVT5_9AGAR
MSNGGVDSADFSMSKLSLNSNDSQGEDWDRSMNLDSEASSALPSEDGHSSQQSKTPRNSVVFPGNGETEGTPKAVMGAKGKRSLSELLRLHAEKGTECNFSPEEATRLGDVLGQWINASSSPYEGEDDFFKPGSHDDLSIPRKGGGSRYPYPKHVWSPAGTFTQLPHAAGSSIFMSLSMPSSRYAVVHFIGKVAGGLDPRIGSQTHLIYAMGMSVILYGVFQFSSERETRYQLPVKDMDSWTFQSKQIRELREKKQEQ